MLFWGFGDFLIQRSTRKVGDLETLFLITFFGSLILLPLVWNDIPKAVAMISYGSLVLPIAGILLFVAAIFEFEAFKEGKLSVIEPILSLEVLVSILAAFLILGEMLGIWTLVLIILLVAGLFLVSYKGKIFSHKIFLERGVLVGIAGALLMGLANFYVGFGARQTGSLMINFFISLISCLGSGVILISKGRTKNLFAPLLQAPQIYIPMIIFDNVAWIAFGIAMILAPIGIAVALSESYIIVAVLFGKFFNKEKMERHQNIGLFLALITALILAANTI